MFINVCVIFHKYGYVFTFILRVCMIPLVISKVKEQKICEDNDYRLSKKLFRLCFADQISFKLF